MKSHRLFGLALIFCALFLSSESCHAQKYSPEFQALLNQIQQNYLAQKGDNLSALRNRHPTVVATLIGYSLRQQTVYVQQNSSLKNQFTNLQREARAYIEEVARTTTARLVDGSLFNPEDLWNMVNGALQGRDDGWILETFGVRTGTMPPVLAASSRSQPPGRSVADPAFEKKETNQIELFGKVAPQVNRPPRETPPPPPRQVTLNPDGIQGNWFAREGKLQLNIRKQGDIYLGSASGETGLAYSFLKLNMVCLRLKYVGAGKEGPIFKGQYYGSSAATAPDSWKDVTFYYRFRWGKEVFSTAQGGEVGVMDFIK